MHYFSDLFDKVPTCFGQVHRQEYLNTVYTATCVCHVSYFGSLLASSSWPS